jgi:hypothetical protein
MTLQSDLYIFRAVAEIKVPDQFGSRFGGKRVLAKASGDNEDFGHTCRFGYVCPACAFGELRFDDCFGHFNRFDHFQCYSPIAIEIRLWGQKV